MNIASSNHSIATRAFLAMTTMAALLSSSLTVGEGHHPLFVRGYAPKQDVIHPHALPPQNGSPTGVSYYGGPVISNVEIELVFWGPNVDMQTQVQMPFFYQMITDSTYLDWLKIYNTNIASVSGKFGTRQFIGRGFLAGTHTITPQNAQLLLTQGDIEREIEWQIDHKMLPRPSKNTLYMIHFPKGVEIDISWGRSCVTWSGDHEAYISPTYGNIYYAMLPHLACNSFSDLTMAASHELAESITDPVAPLANQPIAYPAAWIRSDGQEIGDLCAWQKATLQSQLRPKVQFTVQAEWDNTAMACKGGEFTSVKW